MTIEENNVTVTPPEATKDSAVQKPAEKPPLPPEYGGRKNAPEATRYGDWELNGKCVDF